MAERARVYPLRREPQPARESRRPEAPHSEPHTRPEPHLHPEPLWREVLGRRLRVLRQEQRETLAETAARAGISPQYLSEIERGRKEPSSEMIAALAGALGTSLTGLTEQVAGDLRRQQALSLAPCTSESRPPARRASQPRASGPVMLSLAA